MSGGMELVRLPTYVMDGHPFQDLIVRHREQVDRRIHERIALHAPGDSVLEEHFQGGKRLRAGATMLIRSALCADDRGGDMALDLAAAVELAHGISLMIDDLLDGEGTRRGMATLQRQRGPTLTMMTAVGLLAVPYALVAPHGQAVVEHLAGTHEVMVRGAIEELRPIAPHPDMGSYHRLISMKSGELFVLASLYGALASGCCQEKADLAGTYGGCLGMVHQVSDDIVDLRAAVAQGKGPGGSEGLLFHCLVEDLREQRDMLQLRALTEDVEQALERELRSQVRRAQRAARAIYDAVGRCGDRRSSIEATLPALLSAPTEIAGMLVHEAQGGPRESSDDRS